eukprot:TRINITY_DN70562_c0_g1_i1.p1 TRINITY_DN70562_c0_g1~~TRINITY_DN70562_c0_g1_i1.p1  ORF type:complete len:294 (-),score=39.47 TRINITY_DN70562_c0_g1_i1:488-1246(-)
MHAFKGDARLAAAAASAAPGRLFFSFPPSLVYKWEYQEAARVVPVEALLLETDSPSLGAGGPRERNEPCKISIAAAKLAELRSLSVEDVAELTTKNALRVFGCSSPGLVAAVQTSCWNGNPKKSGFRWQRKDVGAADNVEKFVEPTASHLAPQSSIGSEPPSPADETFGTRPSHMASAGSIVPAGGARGRWRGGYNRSRGTAASASVSAVDGGETGDVAALTAPVASIAYGGKARPLDPRLCSAAFGSPFCE